MAGPEAATSAVASWVEHSFRSGCHGELDVGTGDVGAETIHSGADAARGMALSLEPLDLD